MRKELGNLIYISHDYLQHLCAWPQHKFLRNEENEIKENTNKGISQNEADEKQVLVIKARKRFPWKKKLNYFCRK